MLQTVGRVKKNLVELGVLSKEECDTERNAILGILKNL